MTEGRGAVCSKRKTLLVRVICLTPHARPSSLPAKTGFLVHKPAYSLFFRRFVEKVEKINIFLDIR